MKKVACYVRVSTENQLENYSIDEQTERLKAYCKAKDMAIYKVYTDGGYSGGNINRPALTAMLNDIKYKYFDTIIVYKLDRLSRSQKDTLMLIEDKFLANNIDFISVSENFDTTTPFGRAMIGILSVFAQLEKDQITERFTMGRIGRSKAGYFHGGGNAPKGYKYIDGKLEVDLYEAKQVQEVFELFLSGKSVNAVSHIMTDKYKNNLWSNSNKITNCIRNSIYIGKVKFNGIEYNGEHQAIISNEQYARANYLLNSPQRQANITPTQKTPFRAGYMLSSLVYCKWCGARYSAGHGYYKCYSRSKNSKKFIKDPNCKNENWKIEELETLISNEIKKVAVDNSYKKLFDNINTTSQNNEKNIKAEIKNIEKQISKLLELFQVSEIPLDMVRDKISTLTNKKQELLSQISNTTTENNFADFEKALNRFMEIHHTGDVEELRLLVSTLIEKITIDGKSVEIIWRLGNNKN